MRVSHVPLRRVLAGLRDGTHGTFRRVDDGLPLLSAKNVTHAGLLVSDAESLISEDDHGSIVRNGFPRRGDVLLTIVGTIGRSCVYELDNAMAFQRSVGFLRPRTWVEPRFLDYALKSKPFQEQLALRVKVSAQPGIYLSDLAESPIPLIPSPRDQSRVVRFLDQETAQVDAMIEAQRELVAALEERLDAVWAKLYLDLTSSSPPVALRRAISSIADGPFGSSLTSAHYADEGARVIRLGNIGVNEFKSMDEAYIPLDYAATLSSHEARAGDVVMAGLGDERMPLGRAAVVPELGPAIVKADCYRLRPGELISSQYLAWALSSPPVRNQIGELARGSTRQRLNTSVAGSVEIVVPDRQAQDQTVAAFDTQRARMDAMIDAANESIALMQERRSALISAAVTGRIDPRTGHEYPLEDR